MLIRTAREWMNTIAAWVVIGGVVGLLIVGGAVMRIAKGRER